MFSTVKMVKMALRGHSAKELFVSYCENNQIASRATVYKALNPDQYREDLYLHRQILAEAIGFLKQTYQVEIEQDSAPVAA